MHNTPTLCADHCRWLWRAQSARRARSSPWPTATSPRYCRLSRGTQAALAGSSARGACQPARAAAQLPVVCLTERLGSMPRIAAAPVSAASPSTRNVHCTHSPAVGARGTSSPGRWGSRCRTPTSQPCPACASCALPCTPTCPGPATAAGLWSSCAGVLAHAITCLHVLCLLLLPG